ncbi:hypothetical protein ABFA25_02435 [Mycobacterium lepromatosis]|uniref:hypothetical protein n=1 Tax=Mycobacterium lepromatosis TaxID=480418 RepID=UPI000B2D862C
MALTRYDSSNFSTKITVFGRGVGTGIPFTTLTGVPYTKLCMIANNYIEYLNTFPSLLISRVNCYSSAFPGVSDHKLLSQRVFGGDVHAIEVPRIVQRQHNTISTTDLAQPYDRRLEWETNVLAVVHDGCSAATA